MEFIAKKFEELSLQNLYSILQLRAEVFVVEQECAYQDIDNKDQYALHILAIEQNEVVAYARCFDSGFYFEEAAIGRVVINKAFRDKGYGHSLLKAAICAIEENFNTLNIKLSAQQHLTKFYEAHGFSAIGEGYLEDGIPHIGMVK